MTKIPFDEKELKVVREIPDYFGGETPVYDFPVSMREATKAALIDKKPVWLLNGVEQQMFCPEVIPDNGARGFVIEGKPYPREKFGGKDMFGVEWVYVDVAGGSMVKPGNPLLEDANDWKEKVVFPDIDSWDWEGSAELNKEFLAGDQANLLWFLNGCWFERLISFMDFEEAAVAMIDEDQVDAVKELMHELTSLYIRLVDKCVQYYDIDGFCIHDDWGSQRSPFFSEDAARDIILPEMKRFVDHVHSKGKYVELHSCGHVEDRCSVFVDAGFDLWTPMAMNDTVALYEEYGDRIAIGVVYDKPFDPASASEEEQRAAARDYAERFTKPGKIAYYSLYNAPGMMTPAFREELYKASREIYSK
ncbi:MAG: uroporphyrinogen decarboxylase family protein [Lachnospiraceae bacterium]|nr:uroporphyrinogen decarboxylase family protein [Lachnospiraceae bacterium]